VSFFKLLRILIFRNIQENKFLTFLSIFGIALGIALFTGVKVASDKAIASFESNIQGIISYSNYEIVDISGIDFNENIYVKIRKIEDNCFPLLQTFAYVPELKDSVEINGIFTVKATQFLKLIPSEAHFSNPESHSRGFFEKYNFDDFYRQTNAVFITKNFAARHAIKKGDIFKAIVYDREYPLKVVDIMDSDILITNTIIMDIGNFQEYFGKTGALSKIDIFTDEHNANIIKSVLPSNLRIERKENIFKNQTAIVKSFRYNLQFVSLIAVLVGIFMLYNTVFISVVKRRTEIGILRSLGADKKIIIMLFTSNGLILGTIGSIIGILLGQITAYFSTIAVEKTISTMYTAITIADYGINVKDAVISLLFGIIVSLIASIIPAFEASNIRPNESSREGSFERRYAKFHKWFFTSGIFFILAGIGISYIDYYYAPFTAPIFAYTGIIMLIAGFTLASSFYFFILLKLFRIPIKKVFGIIGEIASGDIYGNLHRFSVALMSVAISGALIIAFLTIIFSFRTSLNKWIHKNITADVYIKPASCRANYCFYPVSENVIKTVESFSEVSGIDKFRGMQVDVYGKKIIAGFADIKVKREHLYKKYKDENYEMILSEMEGDEPIAGISDFLSIKYGLGKGDKLPVYTPEGIVNFKINDVFSSYSTTSGFVYIDRKWLKKYWGLDDTTQFSVYLKENVDADLFIRKLRDSLKLNYSFEIMNNQELRNRIIFIFNRTFAITYVIEIISIIISLIGVVNTLLALAFERKREISIIRYLGGTWKQITQIFLLSAGIIATSGILYSILLGPLMSIILIEVVNKLSFGWKIYFSIPYHYVAAVSILLFFTTLLSGLIPSGVARKIDPERFITFE
jgi:putative ABC transport system permease protein